MVTVYQVKTTNQILLTNRLYVPEQGVCGAQPSERQGRRSHTCGGPGAG